MTITSGGNVGIGTSSPTYILQTKDMGTTNSNAWFGTGTVRIGGGADHGSSQVLSLAPGRFGLDEPGVPNGRFIIQESGYVGISNNVPNFKLHISTGDSSLITQPTAGTYGLYIQQNTNGSTGGLYIQDGASNTGNSLFVGDNNGAARFIINSDGKVGIGTTSPTVKLHVADSDGGRLILQGVGGSGINWQLNSYTDGKLYIGNYGVADYVTVTSTGNVGIGVTNPSARLTVWTPSVTGIQTALRLNNPFGFDNANTGAKIVFAQDRSAAENLPMGELGVGQTNGGSSTDGYMFFSTIGSNTMSEKMRITSGGNVLISPSAVLGINTADGSDNNYLAIAGAGSDGPTRGGHIYLSGNERTTDAGSVVLSAGDTSTGTGATGAIVLRTGNGTERMRVTSVGNFGMGTSAPVSTNLVGSVTIVKSYNGDTASIPSITAQNYYENQSGLYLFGRNSGLTIVGANGENNEIVFANASNKAYAKIGTTNGGSEVLSATAIGGNFIDVVETNLAKRWFSTTADTTLYIQAVTGWNSAILEFTIILICLN
jgi:hypothetical protein